MKTLIFQSNKGGLVLTFLAAILLIPVPLVYAEWTSISPPYVSSDWALSSVHFTSSSEGWTVGYDLDTGGGVLLHYLNGSWTPISPPYISSDWALSSVHFTSSSEGWAVGYDWGNERGVLLHYLNGSWTPISPPYVSSEWYLSSVHFTSSSEGWAVGYDWGNERGVLLHYLSGSWTPISPPYVSSGWSLSGVHFTSSSEGWAAGYDWENDRGVLLHYLSGSWTPISPPYVSSSWQLSSVHFTSSSEGWAVGYDLDTGGGVLLHYLNGSWGPISPPNVSSSWRLSSVHFTSSSEGWAAGTDWAVNLGGVLLHYLNGSWTPISTPYVSSEWEFSFPDDFPGGQIHFSAPNQGWVVGTDYANNRGVLLKYYTPPSACWTGTVSFPVKSTSTYEDASENLKFLRSTDTFSGTFELHAGENGLLPNEEGCYARFGRSDGTTALCIREVSFISTNVLKSKSDRLLLIGTGDFLISLNGKESKGGAYLDAKGTLKKNTSGQVTSISISGKIAGGSNPESVFNASFKATLTK